MAQHNSSTARSWDADLVALRDEIYAEGGCSLREAAEMARNSIGMMAEYAASWDAYANAELVAAYAPCFVETEPTPPTPPATPAARKALYYQAQGVAPIAQGKGWLVPSASRNVVHYVEAGRCSCEAAQAGRECWHVAMVALQNTQKRAA
jgi:hypothetical protein